MSVPSRIHVWSALAGILASLIYALLRRTGIEVNADGWAYWQGALSIADGMGYRYFSGDPIMAWPPLYSLYLSAWIKLGGSEAFVLILANGVLIFLQGVAWTLLCFLFVKDLVFAGFSLSLLGAAFSVTWLNGFVSESRHLLIFPLLMTSGCEARILRSSFGILPTPQAVLI